MELRSLAATLLVGCLALSLSAAPLPKPRGKEPEPDLITKPGKYERFDGNLKLTVREMQDGNFEVVLDVPAGKSNAIHEWEVTRKPGDLWLCCLESEKKVCFYHNNTLMILNVNDAGGLQRSACRGNEVFKFAPKAILDALPAEEKDRLHSE